MAMVRWSKQIGLWLLLVLMGCHHPPQKENAEPVEKEDKKETVVDSLSACALGDTLCQVRSFLCEDKHIFVVPAFWSLDSMRFFCHEQPLFEQETSRLLADTNARVMHSQLPALFISMEEEDRALIYEDKSKLAHASIALFLPDGSNEYEGEISIKTRGNTSREVEEKKPFTIKFSKSVKLLGLEKGKSFSLLNSLMDESFIRNALAFRLSKHLGIFAPDFTYVSLYLNGNYLGVYQMTNKIEVGKRSVDIVDLEKENKRVNDRPLDEYPTFSIGDPKMNGHKKGVHIENPDDITGGYRLDCSGGKMMYESGLSGFISHSGDRIKIKSPKHASVEEVDYISDFYNQMEAAVMDPTGCHPKTGKHYSEYLDIESFARYFLLQEIIQNFDGGWCSFMMYKDVGDSTKMMAGPAWDFDRAMKKSANPKYAFNRLWSVSKLISSKKPHSGGLLYWLWEHEEFQRQAKRIFLEELHPYVDDTMQWQAYTDSIVALLREDVEYNRMRFPKTADKSYQEETNEVTGFLKERDAFLYWFWTADSREIVSVKVLGRFNPRDKHIARDLVFIGDTIDGVTLPNIEWRTSSYRDTLFLGYYICGTDSAVEPGTTLHSSQCVEIRWDYPNWYKNFCRRVYRKYQRTFNKSTD